MIVCRTCGRDFPKPVTRGRPPVKCADCRAGKTVTRAEMPVREAESLPQPQTTAEAVVVPPKKRKPYMSGFCKPNHAPEIHNLCPGKNLTCACKCHA